MKKFVFILLIGLLTLSKADAQIEIKKKAEKKANQAIDDFLFGKKKNNEDNRSTTPSTEDVSYSTEGAMDDYTPSEVDIESLDLSQRVDFRILIDMLPEQTQGFVRSEKPQGVGYTTQGASFSTASKTYSKGDREMNITLNDYLGAEYLASAQSAQQFEFESTEGYAKSIKIDGIPGWVNFDYSDNSGTIVLYLAARFYTTVQAENTSESELIAVASDVKLSRLQSKLAE
ncbi:MAG: hypothetical protein AAF620_10545 [Bacteroidota bacterium]